MIASSLLRSTAAIDSAKYHNHRQSQQQPPLSPKSIPKLSSVHHLLKPTAAMERGRYIPPAERVSNEEKVEEKNRLQIPISPISKEKR
jgi:hypothetical protein